MKKWLQEQFKIDREALALPTTVTAGIFPKTHNL